MGLAAGKRGPSRHHHRLASPPASPELPPPCAPARSLAEALKRGAHWSTRLVAHLAGYPPPFPCRGGFLFARVCVRNNERGLLGSVGTPAGREGGLGRPVDDVAASGGGLGLRLKPLCTA